MYFFVRSRDHAVYDRDDMDGIESLDHALPTWDCAIAPKCSRLSTAIVPNTPMLINITQSSSNIVVVVAPNRPIHHIDYLCRWYQRDDDDHDFCNSHNSDDGDLLLGRCTIAPAAR